MKRKLLLVVPLLLAVMPVGCNNEDDGLLTANTSTYERVRPDNIWVSEGEEFEVLLYNPYWDAGYSWLFVHEFNDLYIELIGYRQEVENPDLLGSPIYEIWTFHARKRGRAQALLECVRPWLEDGTPKDARRIVVYIL
jgi:predicted secreted protein